MDLYLIKIGITFTHGCVIPSLVEIEPVLIVMEKKMYRSSLFRNYLPLEKGVALRLNKLDFLSPNDVMCLVWLKLDKMFWRRGF